MAEDIFSISEDLWNIIQRGMENQVYHIQTLLADELDTCKEKREHICWWTHQRDIRSV